MAPVVLLAGSEAALRDSALSEIREQVLAGAVREFDEDHFDLAAAGTDATSIASALRTLPVLAPRRLVRVRGLEDRRAAKFIERVLLEYLEDPQPTTCLVLEAEKVDRRKAWVKKVAKQGEVIDCTGPTRPNEVRSWIESRFQEESKKAGKGAANTLFELVGADLDRLTSEIFKVCLFVGDNPQVESGGILIVISRGLVAARDFKTVKVFFQDKVDHPGHCIGTIGRSGAFFQDFDPLQCGNWNCAGIHEHAAVIGAGGSNGLPLAVDQHQRGA